MFPSLSIPNWPVNRIISIAIRRAVGKYFLLQDSATSPSLQGLEADLGKGRVVLSGLVLDPTAFSDLPLQVISGRLERIEISLSTPLSLSSSISITLVGLHLELNLPSDTNLPNNHALAQSLSQSIHTAEYSLAESMSQDLPGAFSSGPAEPGMIQRLFERLLTRISVQAKDVTVRLGLGADLEVRSPGFTLSAEEERKRVLSFFGLAVFFRAKSRSEQGSDSEETSSGDDLAMSMAIADLRASDADLDESVTEESVYLSAGEEEAEDMHQSRMDGKHQSQESNDWIQLLSFGADPVGIKLQIGPSGTLPAHIEIIVGHITLLLSPEQIATFLAASKRVHLPPSGSSPSTSSARVSATIKSFTLFLPFAASNPTAKFWHKPTSPHLETPHLRFRLHKLSFNPDSLSIADLSLLEFDGTLRHVLTLDAPVYDLYSSDEHSTEQEWDRSFPMSERRNRKGDGGILCKKSEGWEMEIPPVCCVVDLDLMRRCEGLLEVFTGGEQSSEEKQETAESHSIKSITKIKCPMIRLEVSCLMPAAVMPLGVLTLDLHGLNLLLSSDAVQADFAGLVLLYTQPTESIASAFCSIQSSTEPCNANILLPLRKRTQIALPIALIKLNKPLLDGLQIWADAITQYFSQKEPEEDVIGSKFFGKSVYGKKSLRRDVSEESSEEEGEFETTLGITIPIPKAIIRLTCPTGRVMQVVGICTTLEIETRKSDKHDKVIAGISVNRFSLEDLSLATRRQLLGRPVQTSYIIPTLAVHFESRTSLIGGMKKSSLTIYFSDLLISTSTDLVWIGEVVECLQPPEGVFASAVPADSTEIWFGCCNISLHLRSTASPACAFVHLHSLDYKTKLTPVQPMTLAAIKSQTIQLLLAEKDEQDAFDPTTETTILGLWHKRGYFDILTLDACNIDIRRGNGTVLPDLEGKISNTELTLSICPDSLATLSALGGELASINIGSSKPAPMRKSSSRTSPATSSSLSSSRSAGLIGSVDYRAFSASKVQDTPADLVNDDIPANALYLGADSVSSKTAKASRQKKTKTSQPDSNGECISILDPAAFRLEEGYLTAERYRDEMSVASRACLMRINVESDMVSLRLHEGYDWDRTRSVIRTEVKSIRRKLLRVRQMLASGQKAEGDLAETSTTLFNSVPIGLPSGSEELSDEQLAATIDEELIDNQEDEAWENVQGLGSPAKEKTDPAKFTARPSSLPTGDLLRSEKAAIEIVLAGLKLSTTTFPLSHATASELRVSARTFEIFDNIKTSTWHKFLTELRIGDGGYSRPPNEPMMRVLFAQMRSSRASAALEARLKVKIAPLRLHVDQDAVDFLKRFGSYKDPTATPASFPPVEAFIQRVEIFPVKLKLDYKPKRVDYAALKGGKTSELMNFFHFDGSEMTLRYISLSDVTGWSRISDMLQDIWTPDVKANQLASVLAGIAPIRSVVNVGSGMADLVLLPIDQYRKDGRVLRGLQKGATSFSKSSALEALRLGARLATGTQVILEKAESVVGARIGSTLDMEAIGPDAQRSRYASQPKTAAAGFKGAYEDLGDNLRTTAQTILAVPMEVYERSATDGSVKAVLRAIPVAILHPAIGASSAVSKTLMGLTNQLDPSDLARQSDKWRS